MRRDGWFVGFSFFSLGDEVDLGRVRRGFLLNWKTVSEVIVKVVKEKASLVLTEC